MQGAKIWRSNGIGVNCSHSKGSRCAQVARSDVHRWVAAGPITSPK